MATGAENSVDDPSIEDHEKLLRRVHPDLVKPTGEPDSSNFKDDPGGIGTSVTVWRSGVDLERVTQGNPDFGVIRIRAGEARAEALGFVFTFEEGNPNHCEMFGARTAGKQKRLRNKARWVRYPASYPEHLKGPLDEISSED